MTEKRDSYTWCEQNPDNPGQSMSLTGQRSRSSGKHDLFPRKEGRKRNEFTESETREIRGK
jgi:hypothetical protein